MFRYTTPCGERACFYFFCIRQVYIYWFKHFWFVASCRLGASPTTDNNFELSVVFGFFVGLVILEFCLFVCQIKRNKLPSYHYLAFCVFFIIQSTLVNFSLNRRNNIETYSSLIRDQSNIQ